MPVASSDGGLVRSIPVSAFAIGSSLVIGTDAGEWLTLGSGDALHALPSTGPVSAVVDDSAGTITVACWEPVLKQLRDGAWNDLSLSAPAVALAVTPRGLVIADTGGGLSLLAGSSRVPVQELTAPEPVVALEATEDGLVVLAASGSVEATVWPGQEGGLAPVNTAAIGRAHALFPGIRRGTVLVAGARGIAVLDRQRLIAVTTDLGDRVGGAAVFRDRGRAFLHADNGEAWIVDEGLGRPARVRLGDAEVAGCAPGTDGTVLAWTTDGALHVVGHDGASWRVADRDVVLAAPEVARAGSIAIHWTPSMGAHVTRGHVAWNLTRVNWSAAAVELADEHRRTGTPRARRVLANVSSLRGRFSDDFTVAAASTVAAIELEPLEPIHRVRDALVRLRFGDIDGAIDRLDALHEGVADLPLVLVIKALATARRGEARTARNIADRALQVDARHAAAKFLHTETNLTAQAKGGLDKLGELPKGPAYDAAWADLLAKLSIVRPGDHRAVTQHLERGVISKGTRADTLARTVITWTTASADDLVRAAEAQPKDSRAEQVALGLLSTKLADATATVTALRALAARTPDRPAVRRALVAALTRVAVEEAANEKFSAALRAVQICIELEPHESVHHQNRAALFTLLGEHESALDAWAELDRHHYRLALLGKLDAPSAHRYGAPHRMFSQAARLSARTGVFLIEEKKEGAITERELAVNQDAIDRDPEQLRQWLHHTRAALVFGFVALGSSRDRLLLSPPTPAVAEARAEGLCALAQSLAVLVPDEGRRLADKLSARFRAAAANAPMHYAVAELDDDVLGVHRHAVETFAELALLCLRWEPDPARRAVFDEVLDTVRAISPLFDERVLDGLLTDRRDGPPGALRFLDQVMRVVLEIHDRQIQLDPMQRKRLGGVMTGNLRVSLVERRAVEAKSELSRHEIEALVEQLDLARKDDPTSARLEYWSSHLLMVGDFLDEAVEAIAAFHKIAKGDHPLASRIERIQELIDEKKQHGKGKQRAGGGGGPIASRDDRDIAMREAELETQPTSMHLYTELCHELAMADRWRDAHAWAGRALARCLTPAGQVRARELSLELAGLEVLGAKDPGAMASYIAGARASAVPALEKMPSDASPAALEYVRGLCLLAADRRADAQRAFGLALQRCTRGIFLAVLRPLAQDVETAVLEAAKKEVDTALAEGRFRDAFSRLAERMATVARPEPYVLELARTQLSAMLPTIGTGDAPLSPPPIRVEAPWRAELASALDLRDPAARIRSLAELAAKVHEASARDAVALIRKLDDLDEQLGVAAALDESTKRAAAGDHAGALAQLSDLGPTGERSARVLRQRAIVLLRLERFDDADAEIAKLAALPEPLAREFAGRYPGLRFRQRIASASALVRGKEFARARELLVGAVPAAPDQEVELAYCRAYCAAAEGYRCHADGDRTNAHRLLFEALGLVEAKLTEARTLRHERLLELYAKLEADIGMVGGAHA